MAEARKDSKTQPTPQISELSATDSLRHAKGEVELIKCLGDSYSEEKLLKSGSLIPIDDLVGTIYSLNGSFVSHVAQLR